MEGDRYRGGRGLAEWMGWFIWRSIACDTLGFHWFFYLCIILEVLVVVK